MNIRCMIKKTGVPLVLSGAAFAIMAASPVAVTHAYDAETGATRRPPQRLEQQQGLGMVQQKVRFSHRLQDMVGSGKITKDQALKLQRELERFHERQQRNRERFIQNLPEKTGIAEDTLKELFQPPRKGPQDTYERPRHRDWHDDRDDD